MASGVTRISDVIVPDIYLPIKQVLTLEKSAIVQSGALVADEALSGLLTGEGLTFQVPFFKDLDNDEENVSSDDPAVFSSPNKIGTSREVAVRLSRNQSWSSMDLTAALAQKDPMNAIADRVAAYWTRRLQRMFIATVAGVYADNAAAPSGNDTHTQNDLTVDIKGSSFTAGVTNFSAEAFIDATATMGDSMEDLSLVLVHSAVYARMQKNNLIDFIPDARGEVSIPTFLGRRVVKDDMMPVTSGVFETWLFGSSAFRLGTGTPKVPFATERKESSGNGGGQEIMYDRTEWMIHPTGYRYVGTAPNGGPSNAATANNLAAAGSWSRSFPERKQIKMARLITREF